METSTEPSKTTQRIINGEEDDLEKLLGKLNSNEPLKVDVIFEDSDEDSIKDQESYIKEGPSSNIHLPEPVDIYQESCRNLLSDNIKEKMSNLDEGKYSNTLNPENSKQQDNNLDKNVRGAHLKRKLDNENEIINKKEIKKQNQCINQNSETSKKYEEIGKTFSPAPHMVAYVANLLKAISKHLVIILTAYNQYSETKRKDLNYENVKRAWNHFEKIRSHLFHLSYCTVTDVILPEIKNHYFIEKLLNDTLSLAREKNVATDLQTQIMPLFSELITWAIKKQKMQNLPNNLLDSCQQLTSKSTNATEVESNTVKNTRRHIPYSAPEQNPPILETSEPTVKSYSLAQSKHLENVLSTKRQQQHPLLTQQLLSHQNSSNLKSLQKLAENVNSNNPNMTIRGNSESLKYPRQIPFSLQEVSNNKVLFSSGPPGQEISISVDTPLLPSSCNVDNTTSFNLRENSLIPQNAQVDQYNQTMNTFEQHVGPIHQNAAKLLNSQINQSIQHHSQKHLQKQPVFFYNCQQGNPSNYQKKTRSPQEQGATLLQQQIYRNTQLERAAQSAPWQIPCHQQTMSSSEAPRIQTNGAATKILHQKNTKENNNVSHESQPPSYSETLLYRNYTETLNSNQEKTSNLKPNSIILNERPPGSYLETFESFVKPKMLQAQARSFNAPRPHSSEDMQPESSNPEISRSLSTDSGFMSPINFNPSDSCNVEEESNFSTPIITHITSLNPSASYIPEGRCKICGTVTRKMCIGCYSQYYCQPDCQKIDWPVHMTECKKMSA